MALVGPPVTEEDLAVAEPSLEVASEMNLADWARQDWARVAPRERLLTMPDYEPELTLGYGVAAWMINNLKQPNGIHAGEPFVPTTGQLEFLLHAYEVNDAGEFTCGRMVRRLAKGSGKSPFAAAVALAELLGPVVFDDFDDSVPGGCVGKPMVMPLVQIVATSERQTANTMRMVRAFCKKGSPFARKYGLDIGKTFIDTTEMGRLEQVTSSAHTLEGAEVSFMVGDEVEHWVPSRGGPDLMATMRRNAAKTGARIMETCNAWIPGQESVAEATFEAWCDQEEGKLRGETKILYDARIAPPKTALNDMVESEGDVPLTDALVFVYQDCPWVNLRAIKEQIWSPDFSISDAKRFFLNAPTAAENSWCPLEDWVANRDLDRKVKKGEDIVMFFDGSKSNDHTALVGCCMDDGHIFKIGHWIPRKTTHEVDVNAVDAGVRRAFRDYNVVAFWADVREWESFVKTTWPEDLGEDLICPAVPGHGPNATPIAWDMRTHAWLFAEATETALAEILEHQFTHDGSAALGEHVSNCRVHEYRGLWSVRKESPKSPRKIDLAVCMIGARMLYRVVKKSDAWAKAQAGTGTWGVYL